MIEYSRFRKFKADEEIDNWLNTHFPEMINIDETSYWYSSISDYTSGYSNHFNQLLESSACDLSMIKRYDEDDCEKISTIMHFLNEHSIPEDIVLYRYTTCGAVKKANKGKNIRIGDVLYFNRFLSTSLLLSNIEHLKSEPISSVLFTIYAPKGVPGSYVSLIKNVDGCKEHEILLPPQTKLKVLKIDRHVFSDTKIECIVV